MAFSHFELAFPAHNEDVLALLVECQLVQVRHDPGNQAIDLNTFILVVSAYRILLLPNFAHDFHAPFQEHRWVQSFAVVDGIRAAGDLPQHLVCRPALCGITANDAVVRGVAGAERGGGRRRLNNRILNILVVFLHYSFEMLAVSRLRRQQVRVQLNEVDCEDLRLAGPEESEHLEIRVCCSSGILTASAGLVGPQSIVQ